MITIELLLAGEYRTGHYCSTKWRSSQGINIQLFVDSAGSNIARYDYPNSRIIGADFNPLLPTTRMMFERWKDYINLNNFSNDQLICVSRPDLYIDDPDKVFNLMRIHTDKILISLSEFNKHANDLIFSLPFGLLKRLVDEYTLFDINPLQFSPHEYLYFFSKKNITMNINYDATIYRPSVPDGVEITIPLLIEYNKRWFTDAGRQ